MPVDRRDPLPSLDHRTRSGRENNEVLPEEGVKDAVDVADGNGEVVVVQGGLVCDRVDFGVVAVAAVVGWIANGVSGDVQSILLGTLPWD